MIKEFLIGCCYYPEHWDEANMENDIIRIKDLGFNTVRIGEFSWSLYEKEEGCFDFSLLEKAVSLAEKNDLYVILGTPTAAPPRWLTERYPDVLCKNSDGVVMGHGNRQHHNHTSEVYLRFCARITEEMIKTFCSFKNVIGWQIDNELNCHRDESYAESDDIAFRKWLKDKNAKYLPIRNPGQFRNIAGCYVDWFTSLPDYTTKFVEMDNKCYPAETYCESLQIEGSAAVRRYTEGVCRDKIAIAKNGNVYYLGFFCKSLADVYYDIIAKHVNISTPLDKNLEEFALGNYKMYLNHGDSAVKCSDYDLLREKNFTEIAAYDVVMIGRE